MKKYYSDETKKQTVQEFINGKSVSKIHTETGISRSTIYSWNESQKETFTKSEKINLREYRELVTKCERQQKIIQILKDSPCTAFYTLFKHILLKKQTSHQTKMFKK